MAKDKEWHKQYYLKNREKLLAKQNAYYKTNNAVYKEYYDNNKEEKIKYQIEYNKEYKKTPIGRAQNLLSSYNQSDREAGRGKGNLTAQWIVDNIFSKSCAHCEETDWHKLGCNRLDNSKPHTKDNVEPCCFKHNIEQLQMERSNDGKFKKIKGA